MFNLQGSEIIVILLIALVVLGPERLPDTVRRFMQTYNELRKMGSGFQSEIKAAFDEPMREMRETAQAVRDAADPDKLTGEADADQRRRADAAAGPPGNGTAPAPPDAQPSSPPPTTSTISTSPPPPPPANGGPERKQPAPLPPLPPAS